jgi:multidrug efflux pump subunit AcrA (membrane-fusion protein)
LTLYAVAATLYRWTLIILVLWGLYAVARRYHLQLLVAVVAVVVVAGIAGPALAGAIAWMRDPRRRRPIAWTRAALSTALLLGALAAVVLVPAPMRVSAPLVVEYRDAQGVYVTVGGILTSSVRTGQTVGEGQSLAVLSNASMRRDVARLAAERDSLRLFLTDLEARRLHGSIDGAQIPSTRAALADADERLEQLERDAERLTIVAPKSGTVLPPPSVPRKRRNADRLDAWSGMPLDARNLGSYLERGTLLCLIGDPSRFEAVLHVEQSDIELVQEGQPVRMRLDHIPDSVFHGTVTEIARLDLKVMPRELVAADDLPSRTDQRGVRRPLDTWYQARVRFDADPPHLVGGIRGRARIEVAPRSLGEQLARFLKQTFGRLGSPRG